MCTASSYLKPVVWKWKLKNFIFNKRYHRVKICDFLKQSWNYGWPLKFKISLSRIFVVPVTKTAIYLNIWHHLNFYDIHFKSYIFSKLWLSRYPPIFRALKIGWLHLRICILAKFAIFHDTTSFYRRNFLKIFQRFGNWVIIDFLINYLLDPILPTSTFLNHRNSFTNRICSVNLQTRRKPNASTSEGIFGWDLISLFVRWDYYFGMCDSTNFCQWYSHPRLS